MPKSPRYVSDIPAGAAEQELSGYRQDGPYTYLRTVEYRVGQELVGRRFFEADGTLAHEIPIRAGLAEGRGYEFHRSGTLSCLETFDPRSIDTRRSNHPVRR